MAKNHQQRATTEHASTWVQELLSDSHLSSCDPVRAAQWLPPVELIGPERIPRLDPVVLDEFPDVATAFDRRNQVGNPSHTLLHFYVADSKLLTIRNRPQRFVEDFSRFHALTSPDFSVFRSMPPHQRTFNTWFSRAVGAYFQSRGLIVVPNIRWATVDDLEIAVTGVEPGSTIAVSSHGCLRDEIDRYHFIAGFRRMIDLLEPSAVLLHGRAPSRLFGEFARSTKIVRYAADIDRAHRAEEPHG